MVTGINTNDISRSIGDGIGLTKLAEKYGMSSDEMRDAIEVACKGNKRFSKKLISGLEKNEKRHAKKPVVANAENAKATAETNKHEVAEPKKSDEDILKELQAKREAIYTSLMDVEKHGTELDGKHNDQLKIMDGLKAEVEKIKALLLTYGDKFKTACEIDDGIIAEKKIVSEKRHGLKKQLEEIDNQIAEKQKIQLFVFDDGTFSVSNNAEYSTEGYESIHEKLIKDERCENITIAQIRLLAKAIAITRNFEGAFKVEAAFDTKALDSLFVQMMQEEIH